MGDLQMVMVLGTLLLIAGGLVASLQVLDRVAGPPRATARPRRPVVVDDQRYPSYGWDLAERAILRRAEISGPEPAVEAGAVLVDTNGSGLHHG